MIFFVFHDDIIIPPYCCYCYCRSELCLPILKAHPTGRWQVVGIIDIESWAENHFSTKMVDELMQISFELGIFMSCMIV